MKYCYQCGKLTPGEPLYCNSCGRSYNLKLCPRRHPNPRHAEVCSQCGSRDLSTPQPKVPFRWRAVGLALKFLLAAFMVILLIAIVNVLEDPQFQGALVVLTILLALLWWMWTELPQWLRTLIRRALRRKERGNGH